MASAPAPSAYPAPAFLPAVAPLLPHHHHRRRHRSSSSTSPIPHTRPTPAVRHPTAPASPTRRAKMVASPAHVHVGAVSGPLGGAVEALAAACVSERGHFSLAVSGGSLPKLLAAGLSPGVDATATLWRVYLADERVVPLDDPDSNYRELRTRLPDLSPVPINPTLPARMCAADYAQKIRDGLADQPFDLVLLGLGPDGHTCSLFPEHPLLNETERSVAEITNSPKPPPERITLTLPELARARNVFFVVTGAGKAPAVKDIVENSESKLPGALVSAAAPPRWFLDEAAAGELSPAYAASRST